MKVVTGFLKHSNIVIGTDTHFLNNSAKIIAGFFIWEAINYKYYVCII